MKILFLVLVAFGAVSGTDRPVIGILTQQIVGRGLPKFFDPNVYKSFIAASYVKYFESSGARVVPIPIDQTPEYYRELVRHLNGVVFPGGAASVFYSHGYSPSGRMLLTALEEAADDGHPVPALGICLGMQLLAWHDYKKITDDVGDPRPWNADDIPLVECNVRDINLPLQYKASPSFSNVFKRGTYTQLDNLQAQDITVNFHRWCITEDSLKRAKIRDLWKVIATSQKEPGEDFISVMQSTKRPFFGVQFHPEKNSFEWKKDYPRDLDALQALRVFGDSFVDMCRENDNTMPPEWEHEFLIYKFITFDSGRLGLPYEQIYLFREFDLY